MKIQFADFSLRVALLMQNYDFMSVKFCDLWHFEWKDVNENQSYKNEQASNELNSYNMCT